MGFLSLLLSSLFLSLALGIPQAPAPNNVQTDPKPKPPTTGTGSTPSTGGKLGDNLVRDRQAIQEFGKKITVDPLGVVKTWQGDDPCQYKGFACAKSPKGYLALYVADFNFFGFAGPDLVLNGFLDKLLDLTYFHGHSNKFVNSLPDNLGQSPWFYELDLSNNGMTGEFPKGIFTAKKLVFLDLRFNQLEGPVPPELFHMDLDLIFINNNKFSGRIPSDIGASPIRYLTIQNNQFDGPLPNEFNNMKKLTEVLLFGNKLSGPLPTDMGALVHLILFDASDNQLSGAVPESLCGLPKMEELVLKNNQFTEDLGPKCLDALQRKILDVSGNCIRNAPNQRPGCGTGKDDGKGGSKPNTAGASRGSTNGQGPASKPQ